MKASLGQRTPSAPGILLCGVIRPRSPPDSGAPGHADGTGWVQDWVSDLICALTYLNIHGLTRSLRCLVRSLRYGFTVQAGGHMDDRTAPGPGGCGRPALYRTRAGDVQESHSGRTADPHGLSAREVEVMSLI